MSTVERLPAPDDDKGSGSGDIKGLFHVTGSHITIINGNGNTFHMGTAPGGQADETTSQSQPRSERARPAAAEPETVNAEVVHPGDNEAGRERADADPQAQAQNENPGTGQEAGAEAGNGTGPAGNGSAPSQPPINGEREAAATPAAQSSLGKRIRSHWKKVAGAGVATAFLGLYMMLSGETTKPPVKTTATKAETTTPAVKTPAAEPEITGQMPVIKYARLEAAPERVPVDLRVAAMLVRIKHSFKPSTDINLDAETCADPWVFKDSKGTEMLCVPLQYFNERSDGRPLDTAEKRKALFDGAANFSGNGSVATHGDYNKGAQILVPLELLRDETFAKRFENTLPELLKDAEFQKEFGDAMNQRRVPTICFYKNRDDKLAYVEYLEPKTVNEWSTSPIPAPVPERL